jgi:dihydroorotate dehydrogenase (NAD+) catalytic subunit
VESRRPTLSTVYGGLSGPAILPIALYMVYETRRATKLPILGIGGIEGLQQALQFFILGASAVQVGTVNFYDPTASIRLVDDLEQWCRDHRLGSIEELVGTFEHE